MSQDCEFPDKIVSNEEIDEILRTYRTVAVVGISDKANRPSFEVAHYLKENGFRIIPVNPRLKEVLGEKAYKTLKDIPDPVDIVDIFRRPEAIPPVVDDAIEIGARVVWMQLGLANNEAAHKAEENGLVAVQNRCIKIEHARYLKSKR